MRGKSLFDDGVVDFVGHVRKECAARGDAFHPAEGGFDIGMAGMGFGTESVEDEDIEIAEQGQARFGNAAHIGEIGGRSETEARNLKLAMLNGDALEAGAGDFYALGIFKRTQLDAGAGGIGGSGGEGVIEDTAEDGRGGLVGIEGQVVGFVPEAEGAEVVEAEDVVGMGMGSGCVVGSRISWAPNDNGRQRPF